MSEFTERLRDYGLTLDEHVIIHDRRVVDQAADIIDEMERVLRAALPYVSAYEDVTLDVMNRSLNELERLK